MVSSLYLLWFYSIADISNAVNFDARPISRAAYVAQAIIFAFAFPIRLAFPLRASGQVPQTFRSR